MHRITSCRSISSHLAQDTVPVVIDQVFYFVPIIGSIPQIFEKPKENEKAQANGGHLNRTNKRNRITSKIGKYKVFWQNDEDVSFDSLLFSFPLHIVEGSESEWMSALRGRETERCIRCVQPHLMSQLHFMVEKSLREWKRRESHFYLNNLTKTKIINLIGMATRALRARHLSFNDKIGERSPFHAVR